MIFPLGFDCWPLYTLSLLTPAKLARFHRHVVSGHCYLCESLRAALCSKRLQCTGSSHLVGLAAIASRCSSIFKTGAVLINLLIQQARCECARHPSAASMPAIMVAEWPLLAVLFTLVQQTFQNMYMVSAGRMLDKACTLAAGARKHGEWGYMHTAQLCICVLT